MQDNKLSDTNILPLEEISIDTSEDEKQYAELSLEIKNISEKNKKISQNNTYKDMLSKINLQKAQSCTITEKQSYDKLQSELGNLRGVVAGSKKLLEKLEKLGDHCPTCEQEVDPGFKQKLIDEESRKIAENRREEYEIEGRISKIKRDNAEYDNARKIERDWQEIYRSIDRDLPVAVLDQGELESRLGRIRADLVQAQKSLEETTRNNEKITRSNTRIQVILEQTEEFQSQLDEAEKELKVQKDLSNKFEILKKAFSTNGLIAYKIENLVKDLEELTNYYLAELSDGRFTLEFIVSNDKLNVQITDNGNIVDIIALSAGELARVNTATLIAIRKLMSSISKSRINILFLDEVIAVLDDAGREKLVEVLLKEDLNTYVVSHGWTHPLLDKVEVVKSENISRLE